jgi:phosphate transport system substrate-binding protein
LPGDQQRGCIGPDETTVKNTTYALSRPLFMYVNNDKLIDNAAIRGFMDFTLKNPELMSEVGYVQLDAGVYQQNLTKLGAVQ